MIKDVVDIEFFVGGKPYAARHWRHVPRQGDEIMLHHGRMFEAHADASGKVAFKVVRVVWGVEGPNDLRECVNIEIALA